MGRKKNRERQEALSRLVWEQYEADMAQFEAEAKRARRASLRAKFKGNRPALRTTRQLTSRRTYRIHLEFT
jgi:hypothetical protein